MLLVYYRLYITYTLDKGFSEKKKKRHVICRLKKYRILADVFRNKLKKYNKVSDIVSGLINYRVMNHHN